MSNRKLVLDIGNTRTKVGVFEKNSLLKQAIWSDWTLEKLSGLVDEFNPSSGIVSSVAEKRPKLIPGLEGMLRVLELTHYTPLPFENRYQTPETLGKDRVAAVAGAQALFENKNCLIVDCGTCIKYELLDHKGVYHGGNIAPGLHMRVRSMHEFTARLPEVALEFPEGPLGVSTETALQNGALLGACLEIKGLYTALQNEFENLILVMSGGDAPILLPKLKAIQPKHESLLLLYGLNAILEYNT